MRRLLLFPILVLAGCAEGPTLSEPGVPPNLSVATAGNSANAKMCQKDGYKTLYNAYTGLPFENVGDCVSYGAHDLAYSSLVASAPVGMCALVPISCWYRVSGFGLDPAGSVCSVWGCVPVRPDGTFGPTGTEVPCGSGRTGVYAESTTWAGVPIRSNSVDSPCG